LFTPHAWSFLAEGSLMRSASRRWERFGARWTTVNLCVSHSEQTQGERVGVRGTYRVVPNAVDLDAFRAAGPGERDEVRTRLGLAPGPLAVCVGRLAPQKGQDLLLDLWSDVQGRVPGAELLLVGDGPDRATLEQRGVGGVRFVGRTDDVRAFLVAADVIVQPSRWEGQSLTTLEAMACARTVVATAAEGMAEAIGTDGSAGGAVVPLGDGAALADAIVVRLLDPELAAQEGRRARERAEQHGLDRWGDAIAGATIDALEGR
jgi:glycosyltransferase involved in cell wall biosynthesis